MMRCAHAKKLLSAYAENELNVVQRWRVAWHLRGCAQCQAQLGAWQRTAQMLTILRAVDPPPDLLSRLTQAVDAVSDAPRSYSPPSARPSSWLLAWSWVLLAALGLAPFISAAI
ncbi:MAG: zf-HC2 domain-containing protein, partial [Abditibacteriales bacterium]|nr:zf-HC2 domain-containing protein [Abditibacteriales bacterium]MDW8368354.1 zf-HC2 domain-containing protein [Abditibacteriales bacterium]